MTQHQGLTWGNASKIIPHMSLIMVLWLHAGTVGCLSRSKEQGPAAEKPQVAGQCPGRMRTCGTRFRRARAERPIYME